MDNRPLWTAQELIAATGAKLHGTIARPLTGIAIDSRNIAAGDVFVAIKGDSMDGHDFAAEALRKGAGVAVVSRATREMMAAGPVAEVVDPLRALEGMGRAARLWSRGKSIAVTGSVGKTSTKEMLRVALTASGETHASAASFNNHWGVPLTLARLSRQAAYGVYEIGMNHGGEITPLTKMVRPHVAIITTVAASHLGHFDSLDGIAAAKAEIFAGLEPDGAAIINRDNHYYEFLRAEAMKAGAATIISFGKHAEADVRLERVALHPTCCCIQAAVMGETVTFKLGLAGEHMALNSLAVLATVKLAGADLARAALALAGATPPRGRGVQQRLSIGRGELLLLDESYNANPASMAAALALLAQMKPGSQGRRIAVIGDMLELGQFGPQLHKDLAVEIQRHAVDKVFAVGPLSAETFAALPEKLRGVKATHSHDIIDPLMSFLRAGDCVMVKGSLGIRMAAVVQGLQKSFNLVDEEN